AVVLYREVRVLEITRDVRMGECAIERVGPAVEHRNVVGIVRRIVAVSILVPAYEHRRVLRIFPRARLAALWRYRIGSVHAAAGRHVFFGLADYREGADVFLSLT